MISAFKIKGFKVFRELELPQLSRVTLLGGRNNVGKTSVLEALFTFFDRFHPHMLLRQFAWRGVVSVPFEPEAMWAPAFYSYNMEQEISLSAVIKGKEETLTLRFNPRYVTQAIPVQAPVANGSAFTIRTDQQASPAFALDIHYSGMDKPEQTSHLVLRPGDIRGLSMDYLGLSVDYLDMPTTQAAFIGLRMNDSPNEIAIRFGQLDVIGKQNILVEFLKIIEPNLKGLSAIPVGAASIVHGDIGLARKIPVAYMGDGMAHLLSIITFIATSQNGVVMIDEIESGLHYSVMPQVWKAIAKAAREFDCQIVATTHSYECLQAAYEGLAGSFEEDFCYIRLDQDGDNIVAKHFDYEMLGTAIEMNLEIR